MTKIDRVIGKSKHYKNLTLTERLSELKIPGISISIVENSNVSTFYYGIKNQNNEIITSGSLFQTGSLSKPIFAITTMRLVEKGIIDLDIDIRDYIGDQLYTTFDSFEHKVTLRQILCHQAGFSFHGFPGYRKGDNIPTLLEIIKGTNNKGFINAGYTKPVKIIEINNDNLEKLATSMGMTLAGNTPLNLEKLPGSGFTYSSGGYILAQLIVERVVKKSFAEISYEELFNPLSMQTTTFEQPLTNEDNRDFASGFDGVSQVENGYYVMPELAAAGLWSNPAEYAKIGIEIIKAFNNQTNFLKAQSINTMLSKTDGTVPMGLGVVITNNKKGVAFGHNGGTYGYSSSMCFNVNDGTGIVIMQNSNTDFIREVMASFMDVFEW